MLQVVLQVELFPLLLFSIFRSWIMLMLARSSSGMVVKHFVLGCLPNETCSWFASPKNDKIWGGKSY